MNKTNPHDLKYCQRFKDKQTKPNNNNKKKESSLIYGPIMFYLHHASAYQYSSAILFHDFERH